MAVDKTIYKELVNVLSGLRILKTKVDYLVCASLQTILIDFEQISDIVSGKAGKKTKCNQLDTKVNNLENKVPNADTLIFKN